MHFNMSDISHLPVLRMLDVEFIIRLVIVSHVTITMILVSRSVAPLLRANAFFLHQAYNPVSTLILVVIMEIHTDFALTIIIAKVGV
jgi:hypothetical protein